VVKTGDAFVDTEIAEVEREDERTRRLGRVGGVDEADDGWVVAILVAFGLWSLDE